MAILCMVYGQSGTGKSTSLRNFKEGEIGVINVSKKPLPFRNKLDMVKTDDYMEVENAIKDFYKKGYKSLAIDDATYLMVGEFMRNVGRKGYEKYNELAGNFNALLELTQGMPDDIIVYYMGHADQADDGREHFKTIGKMLDNYVTVEGKFTIVLKTVVNDGQYYFSTQNNGQDTVKSPMGLFEDNLIPNDLKYVDSKIRDYYSV